MEFKCEYSLRLHITFSLIINFGLGKVKLSIVLYYAWLLLEYISVGKYCTRSTVLCHIDASDQFHKCKVTSCNRSPSEFKFCPNVFFLFSSYVSLCIGSLLYGIYILYIYTNRKFFQYCLNFLSLAYVCWCHWLYHSVLYISLRLSAFRLVLSTNCVTV